MLSVGQQPTLSINSSSLSSRSSLLVLEGLSFCMEGFIYSQSIMPQLDKFTYFTRFLLNQPTSSLIILLIFVSWILVLMEGADSSRRRKRLESASSTSLVHFFGSDDDDGSDPHKRRKLPVSKDTIKASISLLRWIIHEIISRTNNQSLREGLSNPSTQAWNNAINTALEERFGHSLYNFSRIAQILSLGVELTVQGEHSPFFLRVLSLVKD